MKKKKKILAIDDEEDFLRILEARILSAGFDVVTAKSGQEALDMFENEKPDLVLLDIMLPGIGGLDVLKKMREQNKTLPIFIITAFKNEKRFMIANELNASGFIIKGGDLTAEIEKMKEIIAIADKSGRKDV
ncbi:MAG: response regulator [Candidatus Omnitrophota bacterium]